jgi:ribosome maturation factor RimP
LFTFAADERMLLVIGDRSPLFCYLYDKMYRRDDIAALIIRMLENSTFFLVDVSVSQQNRISVAVDSMQGITIYECAEISRKIEALLNREAEDYELEVSSPGLTQPFKVIEQYRKHIGKEIEILRKDGQKLKGILTSLATNGINLQAQQTIKEGGKKKRILADEFIEFEIIKHTKLVIKF